MKRSWGNLRPGGAWWGRVRAGRSRLTTSIIPVMWEVGVTVGQLRAGEEGGGILREGAALTQASRAGGSLGAHPPVLEGPCPCNSLWDV